MHTKTRSRRAMTLVEMLLSTLAAVLVLGIAMSLVMLTGRFGDMVARRADTTDSAALAHLWLSRDLARLQFHPEVAPVTLGPDPGSATEASFSVARDASGALERIGYRFDPVRGVLTRTVEGEPPRTFDLGAGSTVRFVKVEPLFAFGAGPVVGAYNNRLVYRITAMSGMARDGSRAVTLGPVPAPTPAKGVRTRQLTLIGAAPFLTKASRDTFPYWNIVP